MGRIQALLQRPDLAKRHGVEVDHEDGTLTVRFSGGRRQRVRVDLRHADVILRSKVLEPRDVNALGRERVLRELFERNAELQGVGLRTTQRGGVEAWCDLDSEEASDAEWVFARVVVLAREADRLEAVWKVRDEA